jgi:signal transduction histidine kinase/ActR/RegA family two-component response regulator
MLRERLGILKSKAALVKAGQREDAIALLRSRRGDELTARLGQTVEAMVAEEERLNQGRRETLNTAITVFQLALLAMAVIFVVFFLVALNEMQEHIVELERSSDSLTAAYNQLLTQSTLREVAEAQVRQSQKIDALGHLAGGIAHDFNNMIGVIVASLHVLRRKLQGGEEDRQQFIESALRGAENATKLVRKLLSFSRIQPLAPRPVDLNELLRGVTTILRASLPDNIKLETSLDVRPCVIEVDPDELESALVNLAVNSRDAMPNGGRLKIETARLHFDEAYAARNPDAKEGDYGMLAISDTGAGMTPDVLEHVFEPFFTTKPLGKGTGLGLPQVLNFVKQSGGHIRISSEPNLGTTVKLYFPCFKIDAAPASAFVGSALDPPNKADCPHGDPTETILVVDDDDTTRKVTVAGVRELGYSALEASSAEAALNVIESRQDVTMMITDVMMPAIDGVQLAEEATRRRPELRILYVSGYSRAALLQGGLPFAGADLLMKPFSLAQIATRIRMTIDKLAA